MLLIAACLPAVSAYEINEDLSDPIDTSKSGEIVYRTGDYNNVAPYHNTIVFRDITLFQELSYVDFVIPGNHGRDSDGNYLQSGRYEFSYQFNGDTRPGVIYISRSTNPLGTVTSTKYTIFLNEWDIGTLDGQKSVVLPYRLYSDGGYRAYMPSFWETNNKCDIALGYNGAVYTGLSTLKYQASHSSNLKWQNHLNVTKTTQEVDAYHIELLRTINNEGFTSTITIYNDDEEVFVNTGHGTDVFAWFETSEINRIIVTSPSGRNFDYVLSPDESYVTVYVRNSQTGALLADANLTILAAAGGTETEV
ncbi:MAG: hypothetical protein PHU80_11740, partial [Kiritimatiellae bacterium]|nr:hypothetical protein [Kiritimatiellia bacterium]